MTIHLQIVFSSEGSVPNNSEGIRPPVFHNGERISGLLKVSMNDSSTLRFDAAEIVFKGIMKTTIRYRNLKPVAVEKEASLGPAVPFSCLSSSDELQLVTLTDARPSTTFVWQNSDKQTCCTDFYFDIPNSVTVPTSECKSPSAGQSLQLLPPSLRLRKVIRNQSEFNYGHSSHVVDNTSGAGEVLYQVSARLIFQGRPIAKTSREILLIPIVEPSPPLDIGDFAGEYQVAASASVTTISKMKSWGELLVTTVEPEPLMLSLENSAALSVSKVLLKFLFQQHISDVARTPSAGPDLLECEVVTNLEATTYFSMAEQPYALSSKEAARSPLVAQETTLSRPQVHKIRLVPWKEIQGAACSIGSGLKNKSERFHIWETTATVMVTRRNDTLLLPTFYSPFVFRRFALSMGIKIRGETHNFSHKALRLKSPIQVIYPSDSDRLDDVSRTENPPGYDMCISPLSSSYNENAATGAREQNVSTELDPPIYT